MGWVIDRGNNRRVIYPDPFFVTLFLEEPFVASLLHQIPVGARGQHYVLLGVLHHSLVVKSNTPFYEIMNTAWRIFVVDIVFLPLGFLEQWQSARSGLDCGIRLILEDGWGGAIVGPCTVRAPKVSWVGGEY